MSHVRDWLGSTTLVANQLFDDLDRFRVVANKGAHAASDVAGSSVDTHVFRIISLPSVGHKNPSLSKWGWSTPWCGKKKSD